MHFPFFENDKNLLETRWIFNSVIFKLKNLLACIMLTFFSTFSPLVCQNMGCSVSQDRIGYRILFGNFSTKKCNRRSFYFYQGYYWFTEVVLCSKPKAISQILQVPTAFERDRKAKNHQDEEIKFWYKTCTKTTIHHYLTKVLLENCHATPEHVSPDL